MLKHRFIHQPAGGTHAEAIAELVAAPDIAHVDMAIAYATDSGVSALLDQMGATPHADAGWQRVQKRFLVGIDWLRTQPTALERLEAISNSAVRIHDGHRLADRVGCMPLTPWHPKATFAHGSRMRGAVHGSGNLSRNGLLRGLEIGSLQAVVRPSGALEQQLWDSLGTNLTWFDQMWRGATPWRSVRGTYERRYASEAVVSAAPTEDDADPSGLVGTSRRGIGPEQVQAMRVANSLWIETGNISKNRGPTKPGDQLMMSAMMRVFFGFEARKEPTDTHLGNVLLRHPIRGVVESRPLRFSNNSMDVLTLPVPETPWPTSYDQMTLLFTKVAVGQELQFELRTGNGNKKNQWRAQSRKQGTSYAMTSGREWGVYG